MSMELLEALRSEEQRLQAQLQEMAVIQRRLDAVRNTLALYADVPAPSLPPTVGQIATRAPRSGSVSAIVQDAAEEFLRSINRRAQTPEILEELLRRGIRAGNTDDRTNMVATVSSYLSAAKNRFDHQRNQGYGLVEWSATMPEHLRALGVIPPQAMVVGEGQAADPVEEPAA